MKDEPRIVVAMSWSGSPQAVEVLPSGKGLVIGGSTPGLTFLLPQETLPEAFVLVDHPSTGPVLRVPPGAELRVPRGDEEIAIVEADTSDIRTLELAVGSRATLKLGEFTFFVTGVDQVPVGPAAAVADWRSQRWLLASVALHGALIGMSLFMPPNVGALSLDTAEPETRYVRVSLTPPAVEGPGLGPVRGEAVTGEEGAIGTLEETRGIRGRAPSRRERDQPRASLTARDVATSPTIRAISAALMEASASTPTSPYGARDAFDQGAYGTAMADHASWSPSDGGFGMRGTGRGAGGMAEGTVAWGGRMQPRNARGFGVSGICWGTPRSECDGGDPGSGLGLGTFGQLGRGRIRASGREGNLRLPIGTHVEAAGGLSMDQVRRVVARQRGQIRYCYEQSLVSRPDLAGRIAVRWVIAVDGHVMTAAIDESRSDVRAPQLESCVAQAVSRWTFPASPAPTAVTYPFVLQTSE